WTQARAKYNASHGIKTPEQLETLIAFFRARKGRAIGFRYKDWQDYEAIGQLIGTGDDTITAFQLIKTYNSGATTVTRTITKPVDNAVFKLHFDAVEQSSGFAVDYATGIVTFDVAPADGIIITANFEFDVPVRFDTDHFDA